MECALEGVIQTQRVKALDNLLQGLSDVPKEPLRIHELCLSMESSAVRLLCDLEQLVPSWTVRHVGRAIKGAGLQQVSALVRSMVECKISNQALSFFYALGYDLDYEMLRVGFAFHFQRGPARITVTVSSLSKMPKRYATDEAVPLTPLDFQLVEVTAPASPENYAEVSAAVSSFCEHLAPLVNLSKPPGPLARSIASVAAYATIMS